MCPSLADRLYKPSEVGRGGGWAALGWESGWGRVDLFGGVVGSGLIWWLWAMWRGLVCDCFVFGESMYRVYVCMYVCMCIYIYIYILYIYICVYKPP